MENIFLSLIDYEKIAVTPILNPPVYSFKKDVIHLDIVLKI